jgi:UDP-MurNAc hydroxylase
MVSDTQWPSLTWINHTCFIYNDGEAQIIADPWLFGSVFNNGWSHITSYEVPATTWKRITHIWISHEHPDHFHPPSLNTIPIEAREQITVLFQRTTDKRVVRYFEKAGFKNINELEVGWFPISSRTKVCCIPVSTDTNNDSALIFADGDLTIVNFY